MYPEWVLKHKKPGTTVKQIGKNYYLYYATSHREPGKKYPVSSQTYIGKITEQGVISERVSIVVGDTEAALLSKLVPNLPKEFSEIIALRIKKEWVLTKTNKKLEKKLEKKGIAKNGKIVF